MLAEERALSRERSAAPPKAEAFAAVVEEHWQAVYRLLHSLSGNVHETEDLTQETFLRALQRLASFQPGTSMRNWLMRIASNAFFDVRRKRKRAKAQPLAVEPAHDDFAVGHELEVAEQSALAKVAMEEL
ncbi:MAG TPA: sigma-70 family RNA polymerase sigma factor, partial [Gemmataceae bacterium]|nr:sigma-70 family RNA polymerase sigma factor [Gemmataceae bacterium]